MIYLKKFDTQAAYNAAKDNLILPNVSLITETNGVTYKPLQPTPPTPSFSVVAIEVDGMGWEDIGQYPYISQGGGISLEFNRPVAFSELSAMTFQWGYDEEECVVYQGEVVYDYDYGGDCIKWGWSEQGYYNFIVVPQYEGSSTTIDLYIPDTTVYLCNINIQ